MFIVGRAANIHALRHTYSVRCFRLYGRQQPYARRKITRSFSHSLLSVSTCKCRIVLTSPKAVGGNNCYRNVLTPCTQATSTSLSFAKSCGFQTHTQKPARSSQIHWETPNTHLFSASISAILELRRIYVVLGVLKFTVSTRLRKRNTHIHTHSHVKRIFCTSEGDNVDVV